MKITGFFIIVLLLFSTQKMVAQNQTNSDFSNEFQDKLEQWKNAYNSGDAQNLIPLYTENAVYTSSHVDGLEALGRDKLIANFQKGISGGGQIDRIVILSMNVSCELASLYCKYDATNSGVQVSGRNLLVLKKVNDQWVIAFHMTVV